MNEFINLNDSKYLPPPALTDEQLEALLAKPVNGEIVVSTDDGDETEDQKVFH